MSLESIISTALMDTLLGMGSVFVILIFISLVISLFKFIPALEDRWKRFRAMLKKDNKQIAKTKTSEEPEPSAESVDPQTLAAITAVINKFIEEREGTVSIASGDTYVVRSIRRR